MEKLKPQHTSSEETGLGKSIILYNDEVNTFDFVVECLEEVCGHEPEQAEQCALIAHLKGKCPVRSGDPASLKPVQQELSTRGLTVSIE